MILLGAEKKLGESVTRFFRMIDDKPIGVRLEVVEVRLEHRKTVSFHTRLAGDLCKKPSLCQFQAGLALHEGRWALISGTKSAVLGEGALDCEISQHLSKCRG